MPTFHSIDLPLPDMASLPGRDLVVGLSGGLDSNVLLHFLAASPACRTRGLRAIHVHHGLHSNADAWAAHCRQICHALDLPLRVVKVDAGNHHGDGPEAAARTARYSAFEAALGADDVLVLAHHRDDQAETFLLRALRGSGVDGLAAMRAWRRCGRGWLWRPLLDVPQSQLLAYAQQHALKWINDPGNTDTTLDRNFLRQRVMPLLRERWPQTVAALARSAGWCAESNELLDTGDAQALASVLTSDPQQLDCAALTHLSTARRARVLRRWINELQLPPLPAEGVARIEAELLHAATDSAARFDWSGATVRRWRHLLHAGSRRDPLPSDWQARWDGQTPLALPTGDSLRLDFSPSATTSGFDRSLNVHTRRGGERIVLAGRDHSHALKHVLQDQDVPPWLRERLPLLSDGNGQLLAAGDRVLSGAFDHWLREHQARLLWHCL